MAGRYTPRFTGHPLPFSATRALNELLDEGVELPAGQVDKTWASSRGRESRKSKDEDPKEADEGSDAMWRAVWHL